MSADDAARPPAAAAPPTVTTAAVVADDDELDDILNSALEDFDKAPPASAAAPSAAPAATTSSSSSAVAAAAAAAGMPPALFDMPEFGDAELTRLADELMRSWPGGPGGPPGGGGGAGGGGGSGGGEGMPADLRENISRTLKQLDESANNLETMAADASPEDLLSRMLDGLEGNSELGGAIDIVMRQLLARDVIYDPLREMRDRYPPWLAAKAAELPADELARFQRQYDAIVRLCVLYEDDSGRPPVPPPAASSATATATAAAAASEEPPPLDETKYTEVMRLMQEMQGCGAPPPEIMKDLAGGVPGAAEAMQGCPVS